MVTFLYPLVFLCLPLPLLVYWLLPRTAPDEGRIRVPFYARLPQVHSAANGGSTSWWWSRLLQISFLSMVNALAWCLLLVAIARPQYLEPPIERSIPTRDLLLLVDLSASMSNEDFTNPSGEQIDRLTAVQEVVQEFVAKREGDRLGLIVFGNAPFVQVPLTTDLTLCNQLLRESAVGMAGPRTALGDAIGLAISLLEESQTPEKTIIALTDGNDTASSVPPIEAARVAQNRDIRIHTIAIGNPASVGEEKIDDATLRSVAADTDGEFFVALNRDELADIYLTLDELETSEIKTVSYQPRRDVFYWPASAAILVSMLGHLGSSLATVWSGQRGSNRSQQRLKVNSRTFELEAIEH